LVEPNQAETRAAAEFQQRTGQPPEIKKGLYIYYHCSGSRGPCGNTYIREEELGRLLGELVKAVRMPPELADTLARVLRESQADKETFVRSTTMRLQQEQLLLRSKLDRAYDDRLGGRISDELWTRKSAELEAELERVRTAMASHDQASHDYEQTGLQILELAQNAYSQCLTQIPEEQARLVKTLTSNCTFDRGTLIPTYNKPFDLLAEGSKTADWLLRLDSNQQPSG
jgi:site-specific DNA recombinase